MEAETIFMTPNLFHKVIYETAKGNEFCLSIYAWYYPQKAFAPFCSLRRLFEQATDLSLSASGILYGFLALRCPVNIHFSHILSAFIKGKVSLQIQLTKKLIVPKAPGDCKNVQAIIGKWNILKFLYKIYTVL